MDLNIKLPLSEPETVTEERTRIRDSPRLQYIAGNEIQDSMIRKQFFNFTSILDEDVISKEKLSIYLKNNAALLKDKISERDTINLLNIPQADDSGELKSNLEAIKADRDAALKKSKNAKKLLQQATEKRRSKLISCVKYINTKLDTLYQTLSKMTLNDEYETSGLASVTPLSSDEPWNGFYIRAKPANKTYSEPSQLSGGEQTILAISLAFAMASFSGAPFIILDEPDANLDIKNRKHLGEAFSSLSKDTQIIIISLKNDVFEKADALIGIAKPENSSEVFYLNLSQFE